MNKYVVGYLSEFDGELLLEIVEAISKVEAAIIYLEYVGPAKTMEDIEDYCTNCDAFINVIQINEPVKFTPHASHNPVRDIYLQ